MASFVGVVVMRLHPLFMLTQACVNDTSLLWPDDWAREREQEIQRTREERDQELWRAESRDGLSKCTFIYAYKYRNQSPGTSANMQESPGSIGVDGGYASNVPAFLTKLWTLVEDPETNHLICWSTVSQHLCFQLSSFNYQNYILWIIIYWIIYVDVATYLENEHLTWASNVDDLRETTRWNCVQKL